MQIFVKTLTGRTITLRDVESNHTISQLKDRILYQEGIPLHKQRLIYAGKQLQDHKSLNEYNVYPEATFHLIINLSGIPPAGHPDDCYEIRNFLNLLEMKNSAKKKKLKKKDLLDHKIQVILSQGQNGPLVTILSYIDVLELLLNFQFVSKVLYEVVFIVITNNVVHTNDNHLHMLLARNRRLSESYFMRLASSPFYWDENTHFTYALPRYARPRGPTTTLIQFCVDRRYFDALKLLVEGRKFTKLQHSAYQRKTHHNLLDTINRRWRREEEDDDDDGSKRKKRMEFFYYLIDHLTDVFYLTPEIFEEILVKQRDELSWPRTLRLLRGEKNVNRLSFFTLYNSSSFDHIHFIGTLEKWKEVESCFLGNMMYQKQLFDAIDFEGLDWDLIVYLLEHEDIEFKFALRPCLAYREEFLGFLIEKIEKNLDQKINLEVEYPSRFMLMKSCLDGELDEVKRMIDENVYNRDEDVLRDYVFPFNQINEVEIVRLVAPITRIHLKHYIEVLETKNFEIADLLYPYEADFCRQFTKRGVEGRPEFAHPNHLMSSLNLEFGRPEIALEIFKSSEAIRSSHLECVELLCVAIHLNNEELRNDVLMTIGTSGYYQLEVYNRIIEQYRREKETENKNRSKICIEVINTLLQNDEFRPRRERGHNRLIVPGMGDFQNEREEEVDVKKCQNLFRYFMQNGMKEPTLELLKLRKQRCALKIYVVELQLLYIVVVQTKPLYGHSLTSC